MPFDFGWDIGGVHLKVACLGSRGGIAERLVCRQEGFQIWREPERLAARLGDLLDQVLRDAGVASERPDAAPRHAVTMTAELSDVFPDRRAGVRSILAASARALATPGADPDAILVLSSDGSLLPMSEASEVPQRVAAANWSASAWFAARLAARLEPAAEGGRALFIDVGSTTTDIIPLRDGRADPAGCTDLERLLSGELIYTGFLRTPPCALADRVPLGDKSCRVAPEAFTIMGDAYLLLGRIAEAQYTVPTPDGRGCSREEAAARLARLVCAEPRDLGADRLLAMAAFLEDRQTEEIARGIRQVLSHRPGRTTRAIVAGAGAFLAEAAALRADLRPSRLSDLLPSLGGGWDAHAPAAALAIRLAEDRGVRGLVAEARA
jgi:probable H4MPT-linked C1 transfer pathway protein